MTKRTTKKKIKAKARAKPKAAAHPMWKHAVVYLHALANKCTCGSPICEAQPLRDRVMCNLWKEKLAVADSPLSFCTEGFRAGAICTIVKMLGEDPEVRDARGGQFDAYYVRSNFVRAIRKMFMIAESGLVDRAKVKGWNGRPLVALPARTS